jgi:NAD(P)-dependent dehydrogenase (short-subunit alcohol dehydrogenase family)
VKWGDNMRLQNKVALLTGAAAAIAGELMGLGGATAHLLVREGEGGADRSRRPRSR